MVLLSLAYATYNVSNDIFKII